MDLVKQEQTLMLSVIKKNNIFVLAGIVGQNKFFLSGSIAKRSNAADCKSAGSTFAGSNPARPTNFCKKIMIDIEELLSRSVSQVLPSKEKLKKFLNKKKQLRIYVGADPTADYLHLGHATNFIILEKFRRLGHEVFLLFGTFTAQIGDPTEKLATRVRLTPAEIEKNIISWKEQAGKILNFDDKKNPAKIVKNHEWLGSMNFSDVIDLSANFTVQQVLERDMFEQRMKQGKPIYVHEFFYPLMQGYDSVHLDVDLEIGGTDQTFNMLAGRTLQKNYNNKEKFVLSTTLLENPVTGKKLMSKSEGTGVALNDPPDQMFGKIMALPDEGMKQIFVDCTFWDLSDIEKIDFKNKPRDSKYLLAQEIVALYYDRESAKKARENFEKKFVKKEIPNEVPEFFVDQEKIGVLDLISKVIKFANSNSIARQLVQQNAVSINQKKISDPSLVIDFSNSKNIILQVGRKKIAKIFFKK